MHSAGCPECTPAPGYGLSYDLPTEDQPVKTYVDVHPPYYMEPQWDGQPYLSPYAPYAPTYVPAYVPAQQITFAIGSAHSGICQVCDGPTIAFWHTLDCPDGHPFTNFAITSWPSETPLSGEAGY